MKCINFWDAGYGVSADTVEVENLEEANKEAYEMWRQDVEQQADYGAVEYTEASAEEYEV